MDDIKLKWVELNTRLERLERETASVSRRVVRENVRSAQDDLARMYGTFAIFSAIFTVVGPIVMYKMADEFVNPWFPSWLIAALFFPYFLGASLMDTWLYFRTKEIDVARWPMDAVSRSAVRIRKRHHLFMMILIPYMLILLSMMIFGSLNMYLVYGMITGAIIGGLIGLRAYHRMMADLRSMIDPDEL